MRRLTDRRFAARQNESGVNPMDGVGNMADAMLVLAVGIMLALIINWKVDIGAVAYTETEQDYLSFEEDDMEQVDGDGQQVDGDALEKLGTVFYDEESGRYYIIKGE